MTPKQLQKYAEQLVHGETELERELAASLLVGAFTRANEDMEMYQELYRRYRAVYGDLPAVAMVGAVKP